MLIAPITHTMKVHLMFAACFDKHCFAFTYSVVLCALELIKIGSTMPSVNSIGVTRQRLHFIVV